jgi:uncharacterized protein YecT (DUF1311 family)
VAWLRWWWACAGEPEPLTLLPQPAPAVLPAHAPQEPPLEPAGSTSGQIEAALERCLARDEGASSVEMVGCTQKAARSWQVELDRLYGELGQRLSTEPARLEILQRSEQAWRAYREAELKTIEAIYGQIDGTLYRPATELARLELTRDRARQLSGYAGAPVEGRDTAPDPVLDACLAKGGESAGCYEQALSQWDGELNRAYKDLRSKIPFGADVVQNAQRAWIPYRNAELAAIELFYSGERAAAARLALTHARAQDLVDYLTLIAPEE